MVSLAHETDKNNPDPTATASAAGASSPERKKQKASATTTLPAGKKAPKNASSPKRKGALKKSVGDRPMGANPSAKTPKAKYVSKKITAKITATAKVFGSNAITTSSRTTRAKAVKGPFGSKSKTITPAKKSPLFAAASAKSPAAAAAPAKSPPVVAAPAKSPPAAASSAAKSDNPSGKGWEIPAVGTITAEGFDRLEGAHQLAIVDAFNCKTPEEFKETVLTPVNDMLDQDVADDKAGEYCIICIR